METEKFEKFEKLVKPISNFIKENYDSHTTIIITDNHAKVVRDDIGIPIKSD